VRPQSVRTQHFSSAAEGFAQESSAGPFQSARGGSPDGYDRRRLGGQGLVPGPDAAAVSWSSVEDRRTAEQSDAFAAAHPCPAAYSRTGQQIGRFQVGKFWHLGSVLRRSLVAARRTKPQVLYYPPAGPHLVPALRDITTLSVLRRVIPRTVLHFHAGGLSELYAQRIAGTPLAPAFRAAYFSADVAILLSRTTRPTGTC